MLTLIRTFSRQCRLVLCGLCCVQVLLSYSTYAQATEPWLALHDTNLEVEQGSVLDFSSLMPPAQTISKRLIINSSGHFAREDTPNVNLRFLMGSLGFGVATGSFPNHADTNRYVAQFRRRGYGIARLDFVEATLMEGRKSDFDFNPEQLDRFYYLLATLKKNGIYYVLNGLSSDNGGYGDINERWIGKKGLHLKVYFDVDSQTHWKRLIKAMYGAKNPYTGMTTLEDPAFAGMILVNEGGLSFVNRISPDARLKPYFSNWLKQRYGKDQALKDSWGAELKANESLDKKNINLPDPVAWTSKRMADAQRFFVDYEKSTAGWMTQYVRSLGFKGWVTAYNNWHSPAEHASRAQLDWIDMHNYFAEPSNSALPGSTMTQKSLLDDEAGYIRNLALSKHVGKPFTVSEYGQVFWNKYRFESSLAIPAYASLQQWDAICQHSGAVDLDYLGQKGRKDKIYPFSVGLDPIARATEVMSALLYLRADIAPANHTVQVNFNEDDAFNNSAYLGAPPADISKLSLVTGVALKWQDKLAKDAVTNKSSSDMLIQWGSPDYTLNNSQLPRHTKLSTTQKWKLDRWLSYFNQNAAYAASKSDWVTDNRWEARLKVLQSSNLLMPKNKTNAEGVYQSDTEEITLDKNQKLLTVIANRAEAIAFHQLSGTTKLGKLSVLSASSPAMLAVASMDMLPISKSKKMLLVLATDARNSNMQFSDEAETTLLALGDKPVLLKNIQLRLALQNDDSNNLKVFALNQKGQRQDVINLTHTGSSIQFELNLSQLEHGPTNYFEIATQ